MDRIRDRRHGCSVWVGAALLLITLTGVAEAQFFGQNKVQYRRYEWRSIASDHFEVFTYEGLDSLAMRVLDLAEKTNATLSERMGHRLTRRVPIILYGSHNDFAQTNVTSQLIDDGTGGFTEALRNRVVLPFTGSYEDLRHVVVHELVHAFMFDMIYGGSAAALLARQSFFAVPLWFAEGLAEYYSLDLDPHAEMFLRDGIVEGYLLPLQYAGGFLVYKQGQSAIHYLVERFGEERLKDLLGNIRRMRGFDVAFQESVGMPVATFDRQWRSWVRKRYWPTVADKEDPEHFARRLTDHRDDPSHINMAPSVSPHGDRIAYFSDRKQYTDLFIMSALDGKVLRRVVRGERSVQFESIPSFRTAISWSPDGTRLALTAKSAGRDVLYIVEAGSGKVERSITIPCDAATYPSWSPVSDSVVVTGILDGRSDLWLVDLASGDVTRLTNDAYDEKEPTWRPDGRTITFASDRLAPVVLQPERARAGYGAYAIYGLDLDSGRIELTLDTAGHDHAPAWSPDAKRLAFVSDRSGAPNVYLYDPADRSVMQLTDVLGGIQSLSWSRQNDRLVFAAYTRGGYDIFTVKEPLSVDSVVERLRREHPESVLTVEQAATPYEPPLPDETRDAALADALPDTIRGEVGSLTAVGDAFDPSFEPPMSGSPLRSPAPSWTQGATAAAVVQDTTGLIEPTFVLFDDGGPFAVPDSVLGQEPRPYDVSLAPEYAGGGFYAASDFGLVGNAQFVFSDFLGDHNLLLTTDLFTGAFEDANVLAFYEYRPRRWDLGGGLFHFKNYFSTSISTFGEQFDSARLFSERNFGGILSLAYPFDRFRRVELNYTQMFVDRTFFDSGEAGQLVESGSEFQVISSPSISLVGDNTLVGFFGPVNGSRYNITYSPSIDLAPNGLSFHTVTLDARRYWDLTDGKTLFGRVLLGASNGRDAQTFRAGGYTTIRGFSDFDLAGSRLAVVNAEFRFPFIHRLGVVGPVPVGLFNFRGAVFTDVGMLWDQGETLRLGRDVNGQYRLDDPLIGFGFGLRSPIWFMILKLDVAWHTDIGTVSRPRWHFSIGPEF